MHKNIKKAERPGLGARLPARLYYALTVLSKHAHVVNAVAFTALTFVGAKPVRIRATDPVSTAIVAAALTASGAGSAAIRYAPRRRRSGGRGSGSRRRSASRRGRARRSAGRGSSGLRLARSA